jgi:hypothetical protein
VVADVVNNGGDVSMILDHFLMVTAALIRRPTSNREAHENVDLEEPAVCLTAVEELLIEFQKPHVGMILNWGPKGAVEAGPFLTGAHSGVD